MLLRRLDRFDRSPNVRACALNSEVFQLHVEKWEICNITGIVRRDRVPPDQTPQISSDHTRARKRTFTGAGKR